MKQRRSFPRFRISGVGGCSLKFNSRQLLLEKLDTRIALAAEAFHGVTYDLETGLETTTDSSQVFQSVLAANGGVIPNGSLGFPGNIALEDESPLGNQPPFNESVFGNDDRVLVSNTRDFPQRINGFLRVRDAAGTWGGCSGSMIGPFHFITAGHCIHDGGSSGNWAREAYVTLGRNGQERFYGSANATFFHSVDGWTQSGDTEFDWAVVTLDRNIGNNVGWNGWWWWTNGSNLTGLDVSISGYPADLAPSWSNFAPDLVDTDQYRSDGALLAPTTRELRYNGTLDTSGGMSGSAVVETREGNPLTVGVHKTGNGGDGTNEAVRMQEYMSNLINDWRANDTPPTDRADLVDWDEWFHTDLAFMSRTTVAAGDSFSVTSYPRNNATTASGNFHVSFYASTNTTITTADRLLGTVSINSLNPFNWSTARLDLNSFPANIPDGSYYVGWIIDSGNAVTEFLESNNTGYISTSMLRVDNSTNDDHGNDAGSSTAVQVPSTTAGNIEVSSDIDWFNFSAVQGVDYAFETTLSGLSDSTLSLYDTNGQTRLEFDDDGGPGLASRIAWRAPASGTYYLAVDNFSTQTGGYSLEILLPDSTPPAINSVIVSSSAWTPSFIDTVDGQGTGSGNGLGIEIAGNSSPLPWDDVNTIYVQFSENVVNTIPLNFEMQNSQGVIDSSIAYDPNTFRATITMATPMAFDKFRLAVSDQVTDAAGNRLDGNGNGTAGGIFDMRFDIVPGDGNREGRVNGADLASFSAAFLSQSGAVDYNPFADWNADTRVNGADLAVFSANFLNNINTVAEPPAPFSSIDVFQLESKPDANRIIYLDFNGHATTGTIWNNQYNIDTIVSPPFSLDADPNSFSELERERIRLAWLEVAEDFAPFDINVTTKEPPVADLQNTGSGDTKWGARAVVTNDTFANCGCGGHAYLNTFASSVDTPTFVYNKTLNSLGETVSHEVGHMVGLSHDGNSSQTYYPGHGSGETSWGAIMGAAFGENVTQWSVGDYFDANNTQDDLTIIASNSNGIVYRPDDFGDTTAAASPLPSSGSVEAFGMIERNTDRDYFSMNLAAGPVQITVDPAAYKPNLDVFAALYDSTGALVASSIPVEELSASISTSVTAGTYYLRVEGVGSHDVFDVASDTVQPPASRPYQSNPPSGFSDYGSIGQYKITATLPSSGQREGFFVKSDSGANPLDAPNSLGDLALHAFDRTLSFDPNLVEPEPLPYLDDILSINDILIAEKQFPLPQSIPSPSVEAWSDAWTFQLEPEQSVEGTDLSIESEDQLVSLPSASQSVSPVPNQSPKTAADDQTEIDIVFKEIGEDELELDSMSTLELRDENSVL